MKQSILPWKPIDYIFHLNKFQFIDAQKRYLENILTA